jgi:phosphatidylinositol glycan class N
VNGLVALSALRKFDRRRPVLSLAWILAAAGMCCFPLLPPIKLRDERLYVAGVLACILVSLSGYAALKAYAQGVMTLFQFIGRTALIGIAGYVSLDSDAQLRAKAGLPRWNQNVAWILVAFSTLAPILANRKRLWSNTASRSSPHGRLLDLMMTFAPAYILLSVAYEPLFYACFALQIALWVAIESAAKTRAQSKSLPVIVFDHLWIVYGFLFFLNLAFFGTGNMASISSFTLESVYRLITVFSPFSMAALLILKLLIPFCLLSAAFGVISRLTDAPPSGLVLLVVGTTDIMTLNFFYLVRDHGSWLEIGTSISHFVIASSLIVFTLVLAGLSTLFLSGVDYHHAPLAAGAATEQPAARLVDGDETDDSKNN